MGRGAPIAVLLMAFGICAAVLSVVPAAAGEQEKEAGDTRQAAETEKAQPDAAQKDEGEAAPGETGGAQAGADEEGGKAEPAGEGAAAKSEEKGKPEDQKAEGGKAAAGKESEQAGAGGKEKAMSGKVLEGKSILMIIARQKFRDEELAEPKAVFLEAGAKVTIASSATAESVGMLGKVRAKPDITLAQVKPTDYDAIVYVGGVGASEYFQNSMAQRIAGDAAKSGKVVAAICIAPATLANAGLLKGKKATSYPSVQAQLEEGGAKFTGAGVERDGLLITADGPGNAKKFGEAVRDALAGK